MVNLIPWGNEKVVAWRTGGACPQNCAFSRFTHRFSALTNKCLRAEQSSSLMNCDLAPKIHKVA